MQPLGYLFTTYISDTGSLSIPLTQFKVSLDKELYNETKVLGHPTLQLWHFHGTAQRKIRG